jgi:hypothetical protein
VHKYKDKHGEKKFHGSKHLKGSQAYTKDFGRAVRKTIQKNAHLIRAKKDELKMLSMHSLNRMTRASWADADVSSIMTFLHETRPS